MRSPWHTKEIQLVTDYLNQVWSLCGELASAGAPVKNKILISLEPESHEISAAIRERHTAILIC